MTQSVYVAGIRKRLNNKPELKYTLVSSVTIAPITADFGVLWNPNSVYGATTTRCIGNPTTGDTSQNGYIGTKINALYAIVRFIVGASANNNANEGLRVCVVRPKVTLSSNAIGPMPPSAAGIMSFWNDKDWKIYYDRTFGFLTGDNQTPTKFFEFKIPLRETMSKTLDVNQYFMWDRPPQIWIVSQNAQLSVYGFSCKFFYRDP